MIHIQITYLLINIMA